MVLRLTKASASSYTYLLLRCNRRRSSVQVLQSERWCAPMACFVRSGLAASGVWRSDIRWVTRCLVRIEFRRHLSIRTWRRDS